MKRQPNCELRPALSVKVWSEREAIPARSAGFRAVIGRHGLNEQIVQNRAQIGGQEPIDAFDQLLLAALQGRRDQSGKPMLARQLHTLAGHQVEAAPEDQLRLEVRLGHGGDLSCQKVLGSAVEAPVPMESQDEAFMPLSRADGIVGRGERRRQLQLVRRVADVAGVVVLGGEEPLGHAEVGTADHETDLVRRLAQGFRYVEQTG